LEQEVSSDAYLDLVSFSYKQNGAKYELFKLLSTQVNLGEYETYKLTLLLNEAKLRNEKLPGILEKFYDLYCHGYGFLHNLGMGLGLSMVYLPDNYSNKHWRELAKNELIELVASISIALEEELQRVLNWLRDGKIILTGELDELGYYEYIDSRSELEKNIQSIHPIFIQKPKSWWHFWN
jgi:hypothetical protein